MERWGISCIIAMEAWKRLSGPQQVFYIVACASTGILIMQLLLTLIGFGHDVADDPGAGHIEDPAGLKMLSFRSVVAFFAGFGWTGAAMYRGENPSLVTAISVATGVGSLFLLVVFSMMKFLYGLSQSGNIDFNNAAGQNGTVYIPIPKKGEGRGQVQAIVQGRMREIDAVTDENERLATGTPVRVVKAMAGNTMLVRKIHMDFE